MESGKNLQLINPTSPGRDLAGYVASANSIAVLTPEQEKELANQYYYENNVDAARQLVLAPVSYTHLTLPTTTLCRSRWSPYH